MPLDSFFILFIAIKVVHYFLYASRTVGSKRKLIENYQSNIHPR